MSAVGALAELLRAHVADVEQLRTAVAAVLQKLTAARDTLHAATMDSGSEWAGRSVSALGEGIEALQRALTHLGAVPDQIAAYGPTLGFDLTQDASGPTPTQHQPRPTADRRQRPEAGTAPRQVERAASRLPERVGGRGPTHGWLLGADLQPVRDAPLRSGEDRALTADLDLPPRERLSRSLTSHVEAHVAAGMRRGTIGPNVTLVLNNPVCEGPASCARFLSSILPAGARLTIFVSEGGGPPRLSGIYEGTGERIIRQ